MRSDTLPAATSVAVRRSLPRSGKPLLAQMALLLSANGWRLPGPHRARHAGAEMPRGLSDQRFSAVSRLIRIALRVA